jgi:hypothetical protein
MVFHCCSVGEPSKACLNNELKPGFYPRRNKFMRHWIAAITTFMLSLSCIGCTFPKISITITVSAGGKANVVNQKTVSNLSVSDALNNSPGAVNALVDAEPTLTYDSTTPAQALVTVTTDNGQTFAQSFPMVQSDASSFAPAAAGTQTNAFAAQNPSDVSAFIQSAASHANTTLSIDVQTSTTFQGPTDGSSHTVIGRQYNPTEGVTNIGSSTYVAPSASDCGDSSGGFTQRQICPN